MGQDFSDSQYNNLVFITKSCLLHTGPNIKGHFFFQSDIMPKIRKCRVSDCGSTNNETVLYSPNNEELHRTWKRCNQDCVENMFSCLRNKVNDK